MSIKLWCLGFVFSNSLRHVALLKKARTLHVGLWNGVGGSIEDNEKFRDAMSRETKEEAGFEIAAKDWVRVGDLMTEQWNVAIFAYHDIGNKLDSIPLKSPSLPPVILHTNEEMEYWDSDKLAYIPLYHIQTLRAAPHLGTLVFASLEKLKNPDSAHLVIQV